MQYSLEKINPELVKSLDNDMNLAIVFKYMQDVIEKSKKESNGLINNGIYHVPDIMYRFEKAIPFYSKYNIERHLNRLIELGFIIKEEFYASESHQQKTKGFRINDDLLKWEKQFTHLSELSNAKVNDDNAKQIRDLVNSFIFNMRKVYQKKKVHLNEKRYT